MMLSNIMFPTRRTFLCGLAASAVPGICRAAANSAPLTINAFIDSVGVNVHMDSEPYKSRFDTLVERFKSSGIHHVRDELRPTNNLKRWRALHSEHGIRATMLVSPATNTVEQMMNYIDAVGSESISAIEGQNEGNSDWFLGREEAKGNWSEAVVEQQKAVFQSLRARYSAAQLPVLSPTVLNWKTLDMKKLLGAAPYCDFVAIHSYVQEAQEPETSDAYASLNWYFDELSKPFKPGAPVMATETGYNTSIKKNGKGVSEKAAAAYLPRLLLYYFMSGISRTYLYELMDGGTDPAEWEHHFGLIRNDGTPKPSFTAISALLNAMREVEQLPGRSSRPFSAKILTSDTPVNQLQFVGANGATVFAFWRPVRAWDVAKAEDINVEKKPISIAIDRSARVSSLSLESHGGWSERPLTGNQFTVELDENVTLVRLDEA